MASGRRRQAGNGSGKIWRIVVIGALLLALPVVAIVMVLVRGGGDEDEGPPTAAIVDQLSITVPNPDFVVDATGKLEQAGYTVDYYPGEEVTVSFYRQLPFFEYDVIVFRSHADRLQAVDDRGELFDEVVLFTSEPYTEERYQNEQNSHDLLIVRYSEGGDPFFGVAAGFIDNVENGFDGAQIIMMGCEGLLTDTTAKAFIDRGAESYISWNETVTAAHTDAATSVLLGHLVLDGLSPSAAVAETMSQLGSDPLFGSELVAYPPED